MTALIFFSLTLLGSLLMNAPDKNYQEWYLQRPDVYIFVKEMGKGKDTVMVVHSRFGANHDYM